jgi:hypothetical protein
MSFDNIVLDGNLPYPQYVYQQPILTNKVTYNTTPVNAMLNNINFPPGKKYNYYPSIEQIRGNIVFKAFEKVGFNEIQTIMHITGLIENKLVYKEELVPIYIVVKREFFNKWLYKNNISGY